MEAETLVLNLLNALPKKEVRGKKRLQKLAYLAVNSGAKADAKFFLHDFGPFSPQVANATSFLTLVGDIEESDALVGRTKKYLKVYRLADPTAVMDELSVKVKTALQKLDTYSTIELEIASTILFFLRQGLSLDRAIEATKNLKPSKSEKPIIDRAMKALAEVDLDEKRRAYQVPSS
jgi:uncharacterized protein YwgA